MNDQQELDTKTSKVIRLVDYLSRLATLRSKLIRDIDQYQKVLWLSDVPHEHECFTQAWGGDEEHESDEWLEVRNRSEPELPTIPSSCKDWVNQSSIRNKDDLPELYQQITRQIPNPDWIEGSDQPEIITQREDLADHPEIPKSWETYIEDKWLPWTEQHNAWETVHRVYSALFTTYQEQVRLGEEYELILGLGLLTWQTPTGQRVRRHMVVADANLEFEARLGKFIVRPHTDGAKVRPELDMLDITERPERGEEAAKSSLAGAEDNPWSKGCVEGVLQALVHSIDSQGEYESSLEAGSRRVSTKPVVEYAPAIILRKRSARGLTETLKKIKEQIEGGEEIPGEFADIAEVKQEDSRAPDDVPIEPNGVFDGEIFFPKPSNDEQRRIVNKIQGSSGVLVQGPPGTGKSHTIANLICHLLATGQRTLITAKTPRALQVLEGHIPEELQPLCINLLGSGLEERRSLESSVGGILRENQQWNESRATREREELERRLRELREEQARTNRQLRDIRESETHSQSIAEGTYRGTAARIAEAVNRDRKKFGWFMDTVPTHKACPVVAVDLRRALAGLRDFVPEKREELAHVWPEQYPSPERFSSLVRSEADACAEHESTKHGTDERLVGLLSKCSDQAIEEIRDAFSAFQAAHRKISGAPRPWISSALQDILGGNAPLWRELLDVTNSVISSIEKEVEEADDTRLEFPDAVDAKMLYEDACTLAKHLENGGKLGWGVFRPKVVKERIHVVRDVQVDGRACATLDHFHTLTSALHVRNECEKAWGYWKGKVEQMHGPYRLQLASLKSLRDTLADALTLNGLIAKCQQAVDQCPGLREPIWADESQIESVVASCRHTLAGIAKQRATEEIEKVEARFSAVSADRNAHSVIHDLLAAIRERDTNSFSNCTRMIGHLEEQRHRLQKVNGYLLKLEKLLPKFATDLQQTSGNPDWDERILHIDEAWHWGQARYWIEEYIRGENVPALAKRVKQIEDEINDVITKLAAINAWSFCFSRLKDDHRRHMEAWQQSMRRLGKGTGKHAPRHRREAQAHLNACREAVPAWVMPLHRVWDTVLPAPGMFDVVIVDEASQCGVEALPLFYLAKKVVIVGDDKQISPDAVGLPRDAVHRLMQEFLYDFEFKSSFDVESSLFDHGKLRYGMQRITLREHFRCMPEIIRFSNDLCYSDTPLIPLRQYGPDRLPPLEHQFVSGGYREGRGNRTINRPEADAVVDRIKKICGDSKYDDKTIGVVVLQGEAQASQIEAQLLDGLGAEEMEHRRLVCGNPYSFQGDERDLMLLSLVAATNERIGPLTKAADERRFNVAASRARDQMVLFHSVTCDDLSVHDLRRRLLESFENTRSKQIAGIERGDLERLALQDQRDVVNPPTPFDSWFEVDVALALLRKDFTVLPQYEFAGKRIDLVVEGGHARLAIECDGDHWHGPDQYERDMQRQRQLERCGWQFFRVRESAFYANREDALSSLWQRLEERGIYPIGLNLAVDDHEENERSDPRAGANHSEFKEEKGEPSGATHEPPFTLAPTSNGVIESAVDGVTTQQIRGAITVVLEACPNYSCTLDSLTRRVLSHLEIRTRGKPWRKFDARVKKQVEQLGKDGLVEKYKATNERVRLTKAGLTSQCSGRP